MTMLSPAATYHAELREQLGSVGRALSIQRGLVWLARGLAFGTAVVLGLVIWSWARDGVAKLPVALLVAVPLGLAVVAALGSLFVRHKTPDLARRVDRAARLQERSTTALELGARGEEFPLALAQMRDAVEHLKRVDLLETFPPRMPRTELLASFFIVALAVIVALSPNPWLLRARASNPAITIAREQAQRVQRLADAIQPQGSAELEALRQLVSKGARTMEARSTEPDAALNALQDLEEQVRQMSLGDDQLSAALAAIAGALAADQATQQMANAINTGDMREIAQAAKDLARAAADMSGQDQQRVAKVLRDASGRAGRVSQSVAGQLSDAADALQAAAGANAAGQMSEQSQAGQAQQGASSNSARAASDALNQLSDSAAAAGERQRAASQLESSRNALERALGRTQSRSGSTGRSTSSSSGRSSQNTSSNQSGDSGDQSQGSGQSQAGGQGGGADGASGGSPGTDQGNGGDASPGGGYSTGGQNQNRTGPSSQLDAITTPQQVSSNGAFVPDTSSTNPYLGDAGAGAAQAADENVQPSFSRKPTSGNDTGAIPIGLRDLVKDYFSSLDQK